MAKFNLKGMTRKELNKLRGDVDKALDKLAQQDRKAALAAAEKAAAAHGFTLSELAGAAPAKRKSAAPKTKGKPKYANPADKSQTWTGKGRQPDWFKSAVASGADPSSMAI